MWGFFIYRYLALFPEQILLKVKPLLVCIDKLNQAIRQIKFKQAYCTTNTVLSVRASCIGAGDKGNKYMVTLPLDYSFAFTKPSFYIFCKYQ